MTGTNALVELTATNFLSLEQVTLPLGPLTVLVGPNASGKTNVLKLIQFLGAAARDDLGPAVGRFGSFDRLMFRGKRVAQQSGRWITIGLKAVLTKHAHADAPDEYELRFRAPGSVVARRETFTFKRTQGRGRRLTVSGSSVKIVTEGSSSTRKEGGPSTKKDLLRPESLALSTLPRLAAQEGGEELERVANLFTTFRVFEPNVEKARLPSTEERASRLADDASNLAAFLRYLSEHPDKGVFERLEEDAKRLVTGLEKIEFLPVGGASSGVSIELKEHGLSGNTKLSEASFGTVRALSLLALLHDPSPPRLTCIEEVDHGLHPHLFDLLVERLREASTRGQLLIATHSPALVNRLNPEELVVCERDLETGASRIPAVPAHDVAEMMAAASQESGQDFRLGELWFSGALGGVPQS